MFRKFLSNSNYKLLLDSIEDGNNISVFGLNLGEKLALLSDSAFLFYVVENLDSVNIVADKLSALGRNVSILTNVITPFTSEFSDSSDTLKTLCQIKSGAIDTLVLTPEIILGKYPNPKNIEILNIEKGTNFDVSSGIKKLISLGYKRVDLVSSFGEFSVRGDVIDIYPISSSPLRIFIDYDEVESIKYYNPVTMLTTEEIERVGIYSNNYVTVTEKDIDSIYSSSNLPKDEEYEELIDMSKNNYKRLFFDNTLTSSIFDYVDGGVVAFDGTKVIYDKITKGVEDYNSNLLSLSKNLKKFAVNSKLELNKLLNFKNNSLIAFHYINQDNRIFKPNKVFSIRTLPTINYSKHYDTSNISAS